MKGPGLLRKAAGICSSSFLFNKGRRLWEQNSKDWNFPLSKSGKLWCGSYIILHDFAAGLFPPRFEDQAEAYQNEIDYNASIPGVPLAEVQKAHATKPFWNAATCEKHLGDFIHLFAVLEQHGIKPGQRLLELGCGSGWMAELLALAGYSVVGTTISHHDIPLANKRIEVLKHKEVSAELKFLACPMESVDTLPELRGAFDAVFVYEALHHAFDWRKTLRAAIATLKPGGCLLLVNEPNRLHTFISYRVAKLSRTHEIGFSKNALVRELKTAGFCDVKVLRPGIDNWVGPIWMTARKAPSHSASALR
ncbi:MAG TPA: class I SAM-dependent methyltransferase [Methylomirabilota bacterium]|nr:class I SAM-dependent methyltransferase [Methylomirabilota bacterium]